MTNVYAAYNEAIVAGPDPLPRLGTAYPGNSYMYANTATPTWNETNRQDIDWIVEYQMPQPGQTQNGSTEANIQNPLMRPPIFNLEYTSVEKVLERARNVQALSHGDGKGLNRPAGTLGPITNAVGTPPSTPQIETDQDLIITIQRNYANLGALAAVNRAYKRTTNSDEVEGFDVRQLKYLLTESLGRHQEGDYVYYPGISRVLAMDTTDLELDNIGFDHYDADLNLIKRYKPPGVTDYPAEPTNLKLDGTVGGDTTTSITWRYLLDKAYAPLFGQ
jgi:hypothetical protein